ncbi:hypothetical protein, partial [Streptomyces sp. MZ04]|uniref:hypothetical protein n=1 Tax=Streptomyces sp. MZ04 TaxID=2559236 RepID=UPI0032AF8D91
MEGEARQYGDGGRAEDRRARPAQMSALDHGEREAREGKDRGGLARQVEGCGAWLLYTSDAADE